MAMTAAERHAKRPHPAYINRNRELRKLGFSSYKVYLRSDLWKKIREKALKRDGNQCRICQKPARCVHHTSYRVKVLKGKSIRQLVSLCHDCHQSVEYDESGDRRRSFAQVRAVTKEGVAPLVTVATKPVNKPIPPPCFLADHLDKP